MLISYYGLSCFKISTKTSSEGQVLVTDPYDPKGAGLKPLRLKADVVLTSNTNSKYHNNITRVAAAKEDGLFIINSPGEYEVGDFFIQGLFANDKSVIYYLEIEKIKMVFLGSLTNSNLTEGQIELLEDSDILFVPIGNGPILNSKSAGKLAARLEPRLVIPMFYKDKGIKIKDVEDTPEKFFKEFGVKPVEQLDKLKITTKDLSQGELKVIQLRF